MGSEMCIRDSFGSNQPRLYRKDEHSGQWVRCSKEPEGWGAPAAPQQHSFKQGLNVNIDEDGGVVDEVVESALGDVLGERDWWLW